MIEIIVYELEKIRNNNIKKFYLYLFISIILIILLVLFLFGKDFASFICFGCFFTILTLLLVIPIIQKSCSFEIKNSLFNVIKKVDEFQEFTINKYLRSSSIFRDVSVFLYPSSTNCYEEDYLEIEYKNEKIELAECRIYKIESYYSGGKRRTKTVSLFNGILIKIPKQLTRQNLVTNESYFIFSMPQYPNHIYVKIETKSLFLEFNIFRKISEKDIKEKIEEINKVFSIIREVVT